MRFTVAKVTMRLVKDQYNRNEFTNRSLPQTILMLEVQMSLPSKKAIVLNWLSEMMTLEMDGIWANSRSAELQDCSQEVSPPPSFYIFLLFNFTLLTSWPDYTRPAPKGVPQTSPASGSFSGSYPSSIQAPTIATSSSISGSSASIQNPPFTISPFDSRKSAPALETDRASQNNRHVSDSHISGSPNEVPLINLVSSADGPKTITPSTSVSMIPKNLNVPLQSQMNSHGQDSPVMNETLSVIQEHISDMSSPRQGGSVDRRGPTDSSSEYSSYHDNRASFINGEETDEEEEGKSDGNDVRLWTPAQVADYLSSVGIDPAHCEIFREQEISGEVLLEMEQSSLLAPIFDLGSIGKRLKIWQKIKALQQDVMGTPAGTRRNTQTYASEAGSEDVGRIQSQSRSQINRGSTDAMRIPGPVGSQDTNLSRYSQHGPRSNSVQASSPISPTQMTDRSYAMVDSPTRPSAASIRDLHHSRRHSSNDMGGNSFSTTLPVDPGTPATNYSPATHKKEPSFDRNWTMRNQSPVVNGRPTSSHSNRAPTNTDDEDSMNGVHRITPWEFERGYFSGGEANSRPRSFLRKKTTTSHSRNSSYIDEQRERTATTSARHSRYGSVDSISQPHVSPASQKYYGLQPGRRGTPSVSPGGSSMSPKDVSSPAVTKLDGNSSKYIASSPISQTTQNISNIIQPRNGISSPKGLGLRATSDAVTGPEKARVASPDPTSLSLKDDSQQSPSRTESTTSGGPSFELESTTNPKTSTVVNTPNSGKSKKKTKKETSAYIRGLEKKTPREQLIDCDYSGWMKKKSVNIMATWKPRLFILKGKRLSYYYSENDTREKGVIDISFHKVLPADNDVITGLHAQITRATQSPSNTSAAKDAAEPMFIFKLVPPKAGLSHAITFTKPTVHYFAVPTVSQGRLWMAALMKATIERDFSQKAVTTFQAKTISLSAARAQRQRPPALMNLDEKVEEKVEGKVEEESIATPAIDLSGLNIRGIIFDKEDKDEKDTGMLRLDFTHKTEVLKQPESAQPYGSFRRGLDTALENGAAKEEIPQTA